MEAESVQCQNRPDCFIRPISSYKIASGDLEEYKFCGAGSFGSVYSAYWKSQNMIVAVKKEVVLEKEARVLSLLSHRNIIQFYGVVMEERNQCLVTEFAEKGSLFDYLHDHNNTMNFQQILIWAEEIALGMNYLHNEAPVKIIHRDLKSKNVVITVQGICKICDFGASKIFSSVSKMSLVGSYPWMAPEVIKSLPVSESCDTWSYGVVLWELLTHEIPFKELEGVQIAWKVVEKKERLAIPSTCPSCFGNLLRESWNDDPERRPTFKHILLKLHSMLNDESLLDQTQTISSLNENRHMYRKEMQPTIIVRPKLLWNSLAFKEQGLVERVKRKKVSKRKKIVRENQLRTKIKMTSVRHLGSGRVHLMRSKGNKCIRNNRRNVQQRRRTRTNTQSKKSFSAWAESATQQSSLRKCFKRVKNELSGWFEKKPSNSWVIVQRMFQNAVHRHIRKNGTIICFWNFRH